MTDSNDNAPIFTDGPYTTRVMEGPDALGLSILTITATDRDTKNNSILTFTFDKEYPEFEIATTQDQTPAKVSPQPAVNVTKMYIVDRRFKILKF